MSFMSELLDRCENSDDADKREIAVYVRKLDGMRDRLEKQLWQAKNETMRVQNTMAAMKVKINELKARLKEEDAYLHAADDEINELHERYCWRSTIPALSLKDAVFIAYVGKTPHVCVYDSKDGNWYDVDGDAFAERVDFWRVLDEPEEESK